MPRTNEQVAALLGELAQLTILDEASTNAFRVRAYQDAQRAVRGLTRDVAEMSASPSLSIWDPWIRAAFAAAQAAPTE